MARRRGDGSEAAPVSVLDGLLLRRAARLDAMADYAERAPVGTFEDTAERVAERLRRGADRARQEATS